MKEGQRGGGRASTRVEFITGTTAGSLSAVVGHPLDVVKTRMQSQYPMLHPSAIQFTDCGLPVHTTEPGASAKSLSSFKVIRDIYHSQRYLTGFYRGITASVIGSSSGWGLFFCLKGVTEKLTLSLMDPERDDSMTNSENRVKLQSHHFFFSSSVAGFATQIVTNPIWVVKTRMMSTDRNAPNAYRTTADAFKRIYCEGGIKLFYSGCFTSFAGVFQGSLQFALYDTMKQAYWEHHKRIHDVSLGHTEGGSAKISDGATLVMSTTAKAISTVALYPYQVVRSRLQAHDGAARFGKGISEVSKRLWKEAGFRGFYKGLVPGVARNMPATWVTFLVYENVQPYLKHREEEGDGLM